MITSSPCRERLRSIFAMRLLQGCRSDAGPICLALMIVFLCVPALADEASLDVQEQVKARKA